jgi:hypothetical protein
MKIFCFEITVYRKHCINAIPITAELQSRAKARLQTSGLQRPVRYLQTQLDPFAARSQRSPAIERLKRIA